MPKVMTKRERVERAMALQETDRVPVYDLLRNDAAFERFSGEHLPPATDDPAHRRTRARIVGKAVDYFLDMTRSVGFGPVVEREHTDEFGFVYRDSPVEKTTWLARRPFRDVAGAAAFVKAWTRRVAREARDLAARPGEHRDRHRRAFLETQATIGDTVNLLEQHSVGLDEVRNRLGLELFAYVEADEPGLVSEFLEAFTDRNVAACHAIADRDLSPAVLTYGDIACKGRLLHSPEWLRREFFPRLRRLQDAWHEHGLQCLFHSDGYLMDVMDDLVASGIDGLNPIETVAGMDLAEVKRRYGRRLFLTGGIDMSQLLSRGSCAEVKAVCREAIRAARPGYFIGSTTESDNSVAVENLLAMREVVEEER